MTSRGASASRPIAGRASPDAAEDADDLQVHLPVVGDDHLGAAGEHLDGQPCPGRVERRAAQVDLAAAVPEQGGPAAERARRCSRT